jgi:hypothetical protein
MTRWQSNPGDDARQQRDPGKGLSVGIIPGGNSRQQATSSAAGGWAAAAADVTKHTHGPNFGRIVAGCPRCAELEAGAEPVSWNTQADRDRQMDRARRAGEQAAADRAYAAARGQLDICCQLRVASYTLANGAVRQVSVAGCARHGTHTAVIDPVPLYPLRGGDR